MIYIEKSKNPIFYRLSKVISEQLLVKNEITDDFSKKGIWILFLSSFLEKSYKQIEGPYIHVQLENPDIIIDGQILFKNQEFIDFMNKATYLWDIRNNLTFGYSKIYQIEYEESKDIDILFYGAINDRRTNILSKLKNCTILNHVYSNDLWPFIRRSKIVLFINYYNPDYPNWVRIAPALTTRNFIIVEKNIDESFNNINDFVITDYHNIIDTCYYYLKNTDKRIEFIERGYNYIRNKQNTIKYI
jgi:hypothetical protein